MATMMESMFRGTKQEPGSIVTSGDAIKKEVIISRNEIFAENQSTGDHWQFDSDRRRAIYKYKTGEMGDWTKSGIPERNQSFSVNKAW